MTTTIRHIPKTLTEVRGMNLPLHIDTAAQEMVFVADRLRRECTTLATKAQDVKGTLDREFPVINNLGEYQHDMFNTLCTEYSVRQSVYCQLMDEWEAR
jgi:hypothetical protein